MKITLLIFLFYISAPHLEKNKTGAPTFSKSEFYSILASGKLDDINKELELLSAAEMPEKEAYEGALLMRKAGTVKIPAEKLKFFKKGRIKLEIALLNDNKNAEFHFLRLIIQEHAPKIVKYNSDLQADMEFVKTSYHTLPRNVQQAVADYSKTSKILHPHDLSL